MQSVVYQQHFKHSKRRDAEIYISMAAEIFDTPRKVTLTLPDGTRKQTEIMQAVIDKETGDMIFLNDIRNTEFEVITRIGPDYGTQRNQTFERLMQVIPLFQPGDPVGTALRHKAIQSMDGVDMDDIRKYIRKQLILSGIQEPETDEEKQMLMDSQNQQQEPTAEMALAMAEDKKGQAALLREQRELAALQVGDENKKSELQIDVFRATTDRIKAQIEAQKAGAVISKTNVETVGKQLDNESKVKLSELSDYDLLRMIA
jgi:hypothetical protein